MDLLAYWRWDNYIRDLDEGASFNFNSNQKRLHSDIELGETLWIVTGKPTIHKINYVLVAKLLVIGKTFNHQEYKYGRYRIWGDIKRSAYYSADGPDMSDLLLELDFFHGKKIKSKDLIGQSLQTIRSLSLKDSFLIENWSKLLKLEPRAYQIVDEELLEKAYDKDENSVKEILEKYHGGASDKRKHYLQKITRRNRKNAEILNNYYNGRCQICGFDPILLYGVRACYAHHIIYLSRGGSDHLLNLLLICPNHHEIIHSSNAMFDFNGLFYLFPNGRREPLILNKHLK